MPAQLLFRCLHCPQILFQEQRPSPPTSFFRSAINSDALFTEQTSCGFTEKSGTSSILLGGKPLGAGALVLKQHRGLPPSLGVPFFPCPPGTPPPEGKSEVGKNQDCSDGLSLGRNGISLLLGQRSLDLEAIHVIETRGTI